MLDELNDELAQALAKKISLECGEFKKEIMELSKEQIYNKSYIITFYKQWEIVSEYADNFHYLDGEYDITDEKVAEVLEEDDLVYQMYELFNRYYEPHGFSNGDMLQLLSDYIREY